MTLQPNLDAFVSDKTYQTLRKVVSGKNHQNSYRHRQCRNSENNIVMYSRSYSPTSILSCHQLISLFYTHRVLFPHSPNALVIPSLVGVVHRRGGGPTSSHGVVAVEPGGVYPSGSMPWWLSLTVKAIHPDNIHFSQDAPSPRYPTYHNPAVIWVDRAGRAALGGGGGILPPPVFSR